MAATAAAPTAPLTDAAKAQDQAAMAAPAAAVGEAKAQPPLVQECWSSAFDYNSHRWYFYNTATGQTQWEPPPGWLPPPPLPMPPPVLARPILHPAHAAAIAAAAHAAAAHQLALASTGSPQHAASLERAGGEAAAAQQPRASSALSSEGDPGPTAAAAPAPLAAQEPREIAAVAPLQVPSASAAVAAAAAAGYYYRDAYGVMQGPFTTQQLAAWRGALPMDLMVTYRSGDNQGPGAQPHSLELAKVLGDGELLARWRGDHPAKAAIPGSAPTAEAFEKDLAGGSSYSAYAEAALAGLPAHDDAVQIARMAAFSGRSIQDLLAFNYGSGGVGDYTTTALHSSGRGRVQAADAQGEGLYDEMGRWADASTLEQQLARAAEQRKRGVSGKELQALRARKLEMKRKKQIEWLTR